MDFDLSPPVRDKFSGQMIVEPSISYRIFKWSYYHFLPGRCWSWKELGSWSYGCGLFEFCSIHYSRLNCHNGLYGILENKKILETNDSYCCSPDF